MLYQPVSAVSFKPAILLNTGVKLVVTDEQGWVAHKPLYHGHQAVVTQNCIPVTCTWRDAYDNIVASDDT